MSSSRVLSVADKKCLGFFGPAAPSAFTLIELLVVLTIISILASLSMAGLLVARQRTKVVRTETTIRKIHEVVMPHYERLMTRNIRQIPAVTVTGLAASQETAARKAMALISRRRLAALELPDGWAEVQSPGSQLFEDEIGENPFVYQTAISRRLNSIAQSWAPNTATEPLSDAECLWAAVIRGGFSDPAIISHFRADEFSDVDGDGFREFSDAWGKPIRFLRWAPFFVSRYQPAPAEQTQDHDAFDTAGVDPLARCTLFPLIISGGPDGQPNITLRDGDAFSYAAVAYDPYFHDRFNNVNAGRSHLFIQKGTNKLPLAPYAANLSVSYFNARFGEAQSWSDDVHNHSMSR